MIIAFKATYCKALTDILTALLQTLPLYKAQNRDMLDFI